MSFGIIGRAGSWITPVGVVAALAWLATVEPEVEQAEVVPPVIEGRDVFYGVEVIDDVIWMVGRYGKIVRSEDGGQTWSQQMAGQVPNLQDIVAWDQNQAVAVGNEGVALVTRNGGRNWTRFEIPVHEIAKKVFRAKISPSNDVWAVAEYGVVARSSDRGMTWRRAMAEVEDRAWNDIGFAGDRVCVVGEFAAMQCSDDRGKSWLRVETPIDTSLMAIEFRDQENGVAVGVNGEIIVTSDGGLQWKSVVSGSSRHLFGIEWTGDKWIVVGDKGSMLEAGGLADQWRVNRVTEDDYAWHTDVVSREGTLFIVGKTAGQYNKGKWRRFYISSD